MITMIALVHTRVIIESATTAAPTVSCALPFTILPPPHDEASKPKKPTHSLAHSFPSPLLRPPQKTPTNQPKQ